MAHVSSGQVSDLTGLLFLWASAPMNDGAVHVVLDEVTNVVRDLARRACSHKLRREPKALPIRLLALVSLGHVAHGAVD